MKALLKLMLVLFVFLTITQTNSADIVTEIVKDGSVIPANAKELLKQHDKTDQPDQSDGDITVEDEDDDKILQEYSDVTIVKHSKPLKSIFMNIYKNYKSTYMGNETSADYKKKLRKRINTSTVSSNFNVTKNKEVQEEITSAEQKSDILELGPEEKSYIIQLIQKQQNSRHTKSDQGKKQLNDFLKPESKYHYTIGPGVNISLDMLNDIVDVHLNGDNLFEIMCGRWLNDNTERGRGKKYDMISKVLPLFVLPFLIQSAIVPFLVTKLKLLLMKSILVGKLAIFLLIISAIKNSNKMVQSYEVAPSYWAGEPSRRSELAASASSSTYNGYKVDGKPTAWIN